VTTKFKGETD